MKFYGFMDHGQLDQEKPRLDHGPFVWIGLSTLEDGPNPSFLGPIDHGQLDQEK
jgi:hypothetical protein